MSILKVARLGHPVLRQKCHAIDPNSITGPDVQRLIRDMFETMSEYHGVGLAAPQVHHPLRLAIAGGEVDEEGRSVFRVLINPEITVLNDVATQIEEGNRSIVGVMLESHLEGGHQRIPESAEELRYGVSVTDACIDWKSTQLALRELRNRLRTILPSRAPSNLSRNGQ